MFSALLLLIACSDQSQAPDTAPTPLSLKSPLRPNPSPANVVTFTQAAAESRTDTYVIPEFGEYLTEFIQSEDNLPLVDILIVIDNSGSMSEEQDKLAERMQPLLSALHNTEWRINVITTDSPCPTRAYLPMGREAADSEVKFHDAIKVGTGGSPFESAIQMIHYNISGTKHGACQPAAWLRKGAKLAMFILSDENENSSMRSKDLTDLLVIKGYKPGDDAKVYGIIWHPEKSCSTALFEGEAYAELIADTKGLWGDICASDYSGILESISEDIGKFFNAPITLQGDPVPGSVHLTLDGLSYDTPYVIFGNQFILQHTTPVGAALLISYRLDAVTDLRLAAAARMDSLAVAMDGEEVPPARFRYRHRDKSLVFYEPLPAGAEVSVRYELDLPPRREFPFPETAAELVVCYENGVEVAQYHAQDENLIVFEEAPAPGATLQCLYRD